MTRGTARQRDSHGLERTFLCFRKSANPFRDALEPPAVTHRQVTKCTIESGPLEEQRSAPRDVAEARGVLAQRDFAARPHRVDDWCRDRQRFRRHGTAAPTYQLGDGAMRYQARAHVFLAIGRRFTARCRRASSARTSATVAPPRARATSAR